MSTRIKLLLFVSIFPVLLHTAFLYPQVKGKNQEKLNQLLLQLKPDVEPSEIPRQIALCQEALSLIDKSTSPTIRASLYALLAGYLTQSPSASRADLEKAVTYYNLALEVFTKDAFPQQWASVQFSLRILQSKLSPSPDSSSQWQTSGVERLKQILNELKFDATPSELPRQIALCQEALFLIDKNSTPEAWAQIEILLASNLAQNPFGDRADNLEGAIQHYNLALTVFTKEKSSKQWASIHDALAAMYIMRIHGEPAENVEKYIYHCHKALEVYTQQDFPEDWASDHAGLAAAYGDRVFGNRSDNLEKAIHHGNCALEFYKREKFPEKWAKLHNTLATIYFHRLVGERYPNCEESIRHHNLALEVYTRNTFPKDWGTTHYELGEVYIKCLYSDSSGYAENAIDHYMLALEVFEREKFPSHWAQTNLALASARFLTRQKNTAYLDEAIRRCAMALQVFTQNSTPKEWAQANSLLALAYIVRSERDYAADVEKAVKHLNLALKTYTRETFPSEWALMHKTLADIYGGQTKSQHLLDLEKSINHYNLALQVFTKETFPKDWAEIHKDLAYVFIRLERGNHSDNIEEAIRHCNLALQIYTREAFPQEWADTNDNLGMAFSERVKGEQASNLEEAIRYFNLALEVRTRESSPKGWAVSHNNLGNAFLFRIRGNRSNNIEDAIHHFNSALEVYTRESDPREWAGIQDNLGNAYTERVQGDRAANLEQAIHQHNLALEIFTREAFPEKWAEAHNNIATTYSDRIRGNRADNLEAAIQHLNLSLEIYTQENYPEKWARSHYNLGNMYYQRIRGERATNIEEAIRHYYLVWNSEYFADATMGLANAYANRVIGERSQNLKEANRLYNLVSGVFTKEASPEKWAGMQMRLANIYLWGFTNDYVADLEKSILHSKQALEIFTKDAYPEKWAGLHLNLGITYGILSSVGNPANWQEALRHYNLALEIFTRNAFPEQWAKIHFTLASFSRSVKAISDYETAIQHGKLALEIYTRDSFPYDYHSTMKLLGDCYFQMKDWSKAIEAYLDAEELGEDFASEAFSDEAQLKALSEIRATYNNHAYCLAKLNQPLAAWQVLEKGKARILKRSLFLNALKSQQISREDREKLIRFQQEALIWEYTTQEINLLRLENIVLSVGHPLNDSLIVFRKRLADLVTRIQSSLPQPAAADSDALNVLFKKAQIHQFACLAIDVTSMGTIVLVKLPKSEEIFSFFIEDFNRDTLSTVTRGTESWLAAYRGIETDEMNWFKIQQNSLHKLGNYIWPKIDAFLQKNRVDRLLIVPQGDLFLYPLHATPFISRGEKHRIYPLERYTICYAPSLSSMTSFDFAEPVFLKNQNALFVQDPEGNLQWTLNRLLPLPTLLKNRAMNFVSLENAQVKPNEVLRQVRDASMFHYYGHGTYNWFRPNKSWLLMADPDTLTMETIHIQAVIPQLKLVVLSACETGIPDFRRDYMEDQFVGLPSSFLEAGAQCVIASLWEVPNEPTALLFQRFYQELLGDKPCSPADALKRAQIWLSNASDKEIEKVKTQFKAPSETQLGFKKRIVKLKTPPQDGKPFAHPNNWAGFYVVGNGFAEFR